MWEHSRCRTFVLLLVFVALAGLSHAAAQTGQGLVIDQTGLPLPGATVQLVRDTEVVTTVIASGDGTFAIDPALKGDTLVVSMDGFETARVPRDAAAKIVLSIGRAQETTTVIALAPTLAPASPTTSLLGSSITASTVSRISAVLVSVVAPLVAVMRKLRLLVLS